MAYSLNLKPAPYYMLRSVLMIAYIIEIKNPLIYEFDRSEPGR